MSYLIRVLIIIGLILSILLIISSIEEKSSILVKSSQGSGILYMNGLYEAGDAFCFTPESNTDYNIALNLDNTRQNIQVSKTNEITISKSQGENLGLEVSKISNKTLENETICY
jgi:hypothetical protein